MEGWPQVKRARATRSGSRCSGFVVRRGVPGCGRSAVPAGVVVGDGEADFFEFGDELAEPFVVVESGLVVGELVVGQDAGGGLSVFLAGPLVVGAVELRGSAWQRQFGRPQRVIRSARVRACPHTPSRSPEEQKRRPPRPGTSPARARATIPPEISDPNVKMILTKT